MARRTKRNELQNKSVLASGSSEATSGSATKAVPKRKISMEDFGSDLPKEIVVAEPFDTKKLGLYTFQKVGVYFEAGDKKTVYRLVSKK